MESSAQFVRIQDEDFIAIKLRGQSLTTERQSVHLLFVIDVSDSMSESEARSSHTKLDHVKSSISFLLPILLPSDSVSIITFGDDSEIIVQGQAATEEGKEIIKRKIELLHTNGCTNMSAGLVSMYEVLSEITGQQKPGALLLTDGQANLGITNTYHLGTLVERFVTEKPELTLTTVGYGTNHNADLLQSLATTGSGSYNVVHSREAVATTFGEVFGGLTSVVAQNVSITLPESFIPLTHYTYNNRQIRIGDVFAENEIILLVKPTSGSSGSSSETQTIQVKGIAMPSLSPIQQSVIPTAAESSEEEPEKEILLAYYRYHVSELLKQMAHPHSKQEIIVKATALRANLQALPFAQEILVQMMLDDIEHVLADCQSPFTGVASRNTTYIQHAAYLSLGRGLRSDITEEFEEVDSVGPRSFFHRMNSAGMTDDENDFGGTFIEQNPVTQEDLPVPVSLQRTRSNALNAVASPFSNRVQQMATTSMRTASRKTD